MWAWKADYSILRMARLLKVSRAGYYAWVKRLDAAPGVRAQRQDELDVLVRASHDASGGVYVAPRVHADLVADGWSVDRKTVAASMRRQGLEGVSPRAFRPVTTIPGADTHAISDSCERQWDQGDINAVWVSDIPPQVGGAPTYLRTTVGFVYLCIVMDAHSRRIVGWAMDSIQDHTLVERALRMARTLRQSDNTVVFHADRGTQYTATSTWQTCQELDLTQSMGRTGVCWDNAMAEAFWSILKHEFYYRHSFNSRELAMQATAKWIEETYNRRRRHSAIGYETPVGYERKLSTNTQSEANAA